MAELKQIICSAFYDLHRKIKRNEFTHYWLKGGRGSTKSSFISIEIVLGIMKNPETHAVCFRKIGADLRDSVFNQILWAIDILGLSNYFEAKVAPMEIIYKPTGQKIIFRGLDDPRKAKSAKMPKGYFRYIWFEELEQYSGMNEIRSVLQSYMRGGDVFTCFYSYNPPQTVSNWVNIESNIPTPNRYVHSSTYLDVPPEWLGQEFITEAEILKNNNELAYKHEYLGEVTGTGGAVFTNLVNREITDDEIKIMPKFDYGIDWGFAVDPFAWGKMYYDKTRRDLYILDEIYKVGMLNDEAFEKIKSKDVGNDLIVADSAEPKSISEGQRYGLNIRGAEKGKDSVRFGIKWLQRLSHIYIDPKRTPNAWREFSTYEFEKNRAGEFISDYPDENNHCLVAYTKIITEKGIKYIKDVTTKDKVLTRNGYKKVLWSGVSDYNRKVFKVITDKGNYIIGTNNHKVLTLHGFCDIDSLRYGDEILIRKEKCRKALNYMEERGEDILNQKEEATENITKAEANIFIILFGKYIWENVKKGMLFIIKMVIAKIMTYQILKKLRQKSISVENILNQKKIEENTPKCLKDVITLENGIQAKKELNGTKNTQKTLIWGIMTYLKKSVSIAKKCLSLPLHLMNFAQMLVNRHIEEKKDLITLLSIANGVEKNSHQTNMQKQDFVVGRVVTVEEKGIADKVYDLTVEENHEFFANGILVHNCIDMTRYALEKYMKQRGLF